MKMIASLFLVLLAGSALAEPVQRRGDQVEAFEARRKGQLMAFEEIERRVVARMSGYQYLRGTELDGIVYTFKFLRDGNVVWLYVDGRSGKVLRQSGQ